MAVYSGAELDTADEGGLLQLAVHLENRARRFFLDTGRGFPEGSAEWRLYRELEAEEREHAEMLATALARFRAQKPMLV